MAGLFDKQADLYLDARPTYPTRWYSMLAASTPAHSLAWDAGTGNGQAALGVAEHYEQVIATDVSEAQLVKSLPHPRVRYMHTPLTISDDELVSLLGGENMVDLVTVAQAVHWFDLPKFYYLVTRLLRKPGGVIAVWCYNDIVVSPVFDPVMKRFHDTTLPYWNPNIQYLFDGYRKLPFPFESVGLGSEGKPLELDIPKQLSFEGFLKMVKTWSAVVTARDQGVDLLSDKVVTELEAAWGGPKLVRSIAYKAYMLAGVIAVWTYDIIQVSPEFDRVMQRFADSAARFWDLRTKYFLQCYKHLPFPFESIGMGSEGEPVDLDIHKDMSFEGVIRLLRSRSVTITAKAQGVDLLTDNVVKEFEKAWGGPELVRTVNYKTYLIAGKVKL